MKTPVILAAALLMLMTPAASQEPLEGQMMFCDDLGCAWVDDPNADPIEPSQPTPAYPGAAATGWPVDPYTGQALQPALPHGSQPVVIYGYSPLSIPPAIELKPPQPMCPPTKGQALAQFATGVETQDINRVISSYEWSSVPQSQADAIINRLAAIASGSWQQRYMEASFDADFSAITHEQSFRWSRDPSDPGLAFDLVENSDCWFVRFSAS